MALGLALAAWGTPKAWERLHHRLRGSARSAASPVSVGLHAPGRALTPDDEVHRLQEELAILKLEYTALKERVERDQLRGGKLQFAHQRIAKLKPTALLFRDPGSWFSLAVVDVGLDDGVRVDAGVLTALGVIGKLVQVSAGSSQLQLLSDPQCRFSARLPRTGLQCAVACDGRRGALLQHLGGQDDVRVGDLVETGLGSRSFPSGVPVGRVVRVARLDGGLRLQAEVEPAVALNRLDGLYVWIGEPKP